MSESEVPQVPDEPEERGAPQLPDWGLLPDHPLEFFQLRPGFGRTELKRAYNRWLRIYKPERAPAEFQRLRAAYEHLEEQLRYGDITPGVGDTLLGSRTVEPPPPPPEASAAVAELDVRAALAERDPAHVLEELSARPEKSPGNWIRQALLADALAPDTSLALHRTLLAGFRATDAAPELVRFLVEVCREPLEPDEAAKFLPQLARLTRERPGLDPSSFYYLTEPIWIELLARASFESFARLLSECETTVGEAGFRGALVLHLLLLRRAAFRADPAWLERTHRGVAERYRELGPELQYELDLIDWLAGYRGLREQFVGVHPWRGVLDEALVEITRGDELAADRAFLAAQMAALDDPEGLLEAFEPDSEEDLRPVLGPLFWYADEVAERHGATPDPRPATVRNRVRELLNEVEHRTDRSLLGRMWHASGLLFFALHVLLGALPVYFVKELQGTPRALGALACAGWVLLLACAYFSGWSARLASRPNWFFARRLYGRLWRDLSLRFLRNTRISHSALVACVMENEQEGITNRPYLLALLQQDVGLVLYSQALRFAR